MDIILRSEINFRTDSRAAARNNEVSPQTDRPR